jgi:hypothetical protein
MKKKSGVPRTEGQMKSATGTGSRRERRSGTCRWMMTTEGRKRRTSRMTQRRTSLPDNSAEGRETARRMTARAKTSSASSFFR